MPSSHPSLGLRVFFLSFFRRAPPVPLVVLPKSCSCRCGDPVLLPYPSFALSAFFLSFFRVDSKSRTLVLPSREIPTQLSLKSLCGGGVSSSHPSFGSFFSFFEQRNIHKNNSTQVQANLHKPHRYDPRRSDTVQQEAQKEFYNKAPSHDTDWARDWRALALTHRKNLQTGDDRSLDGAAVWSVARWDCLAPLLALDIHVF